MRARVWALRLLLVGVIIGTWAYLVGPGGVSPLLLPQLDRTAESFVSLVQDPELWADAGYTLFEILVSFVIAVAAGLSVGFFCSRTPLRARVAEPVLAWGYMAPLVLFYTLFILWFGVDMWSKIAYGSASAFFPIAFNSLRGFRAVDQRYIRVARAFGASPRQTDRLVKMQAALPMVMSGIRIGAALNIITVILAEMLASQRGLGYRLARAGHTLQVPDVFALIAIILVMVAVLQLVIQRVGRAPHQE